MERRDKVPDIRMVADQLLDDLRSDDRPLGLVHQDEGEGAITDAGANEYLDAVGTIGANEMTEDDLVALSIELARRLIDLERRQ